MDDISQLAEGSVRVRRPSLKKRLAEASDDEDIPRRVKKPKARKRAKTESTEVTPTPTPEEEHVDIDGDVDMDTPVDVEGGARSRKATPSEPSLPSLPTISSKKDKLAVDAKAAASGKRVAKKRQIVWSDDEDDEPSPTSQSKPTIDDEDGEDGFEPANHAAPPAKKNGTTSAKNGKGLVSVKAAKRKNTKDDKPILMKDESKPRLLAAAVPTDETASVNTPATSSQAASSSKLESESADGGNVPLEEVKPAPAVLPKRKLPTIKKNKPTVSAPSTGTSTPTLPKPINPILPKTALSANPSAPPQRKPTLPPANNKELDLFNSGVYAELFGKGGASAPRSGVNRREKDERRKELERMRDTARAAREADAKNSFDLQAQSEKIGRFEDRLRQGRTRAFLPNFIAGALQDRYDREQRALSGH